MRKFLLLLLCGLFTIGQLAAQARRITGKVTGPNGEPVPNASVLVKGSTTGTTTNAEGTFILTVPASAKTLTISSVNFAPAEVAVADNITVTLSASTASLSEVVVVAYGQVKKTNLTGSVAAIKGGELENKPFTSVDKALQGAVAGLQSSSVSGAPGSNTQIRIRGIGSIQANANPIWVIDGVIANTGDLTVNTTTANVLSSINPDDIESISVLKDAAATAIYGSRAANGIILVTTKQGKAGKTRLNFSTEIGQNDIAFTNKHNRAATTAENQTLLREALINAGYAADNNEADAIIVDPVNGFGLKPDVNTKWLKEVTQKGTQQQYNLSLSGGNDKTTIYASGGYFKQLGTTIATDFKRYNGSITITHKATDRISFTAGLNGSSSSQTTPTNGGAFANPVLASFFLPPWYAPRNADGSLKYNDAEGQFPLKGGTFNPLVQAAFNKNSAKQTTFRGHVSGEVKVLKDLKFTSRYAAEYIDISEDQYRNPFYGDGYANGGDAFSAYTRVFNWTFSNFFDYKRNLNKTEDIYFDLKLGYEASAIKNYALQAGGQAFPASLALRYLASSGTPTTAYAIPSDRANTSIFSQGDINYRDRYVISGSFRRDGSSVFGDRYRFGNFHSVGASWNVNEEGFLQDISCISLLKLRASYGTTGNSNGFGYYTALATYIYGNNYTGLPGSAPNNVGNPNLTWEKNKQGNIGIDITLFKNRL
jgi:TonB-linked SusC/RagA family outer membrane protein